MEQGAVMCIEPFIFDDSYHRKVRQAIQQGDFILHYQPQMSAETNTLSGFECLLRWRVNGRIFPPDSFVPDLESTGLIVDVGHWAIHQAIGQAAKWRRDMPGFNLPISVNVSPKQIRANLIHSVEGALREHGLTYADKPIVLEITESAAVQKWAAPVINELADKGMSFALDDFGTGYSSLFAIGELPIDVLKVDKAFAIKLQQGDSYLPVLESILKLGESLGLKTVVEGIETKDVLERAIGVGCRHWQGYLESRPIPVEELNEKYGFASFG